MSRDRLQKILAQAGISSRRAAEQLITGGHVRLNGRIVTELGIKADGRRDRIEVDGKKIVGEHRAYYLLHKPREVVTTLADPEGRPTIADLVSRIPERVFPVGRLDFHTSGALLLTNDGDMTQALLHPRKHVPKTYIAKIQGDLPLTALQALREGVVLDDGHKTSKSETFVVNAERGNTWIQITITEGKNRQIHRMLEALGFNVQRLARTTFAGLDVEGMRPGQTRPLNDSEIAKLKRDYLNPSKKEEANRKQRARWERAEASAGTEMEDAVNAEDGDVEEPISAPQHASADQQPTRVPPARKTKSDGFRPPQRRAPDPEPERGPLSDQFSRRKAQALRDTRTEQPRAPKHDRFTGPKPLGLRGPKPDRFNAPKPDDTRSSKPHRFTPTRPDAFRGPKPDRFRRPKPPDELRGSKPDRFRGPKPPDDRRAPKPDRFGAPKPDLHHASKPYGLRFPKKPKRPPGSLPDRLTGHKPDALRSSKPDRFRGAKPARFSAPRPDDLRASKPDRFQGSKPSRFKPPRPDRLHSAKLRPPDPTTPRGPRPDRSRGPKPPDDLRATKPDRVKPKRGRHAPKPEGLRDANQQPIRGADPKALRLSANKARTKLRRKHSAS